MPSKGQTSDMSSTANFCVVYCSEDTNSQPFGFSPLDERIGIFTVFSTRKIPFLRPKSKKKTLVNLKATAQKRVFLSEVRHGYVCVRVVLRSINHHFPY